MGIMKVQTFFSIVRMIKTFPFDWTLITKEGSIVHWNRESIVQKAIEENCSHVLFVDTDMVFDADAAGRLLRRDKDIIGVDYNTRKLPTVSTVKIHDENGDFIKEEKDGLLKCAGVGTGFMLIKTLVFTKLSHPWFMFESNDKGEVVYGEDMWFCNKARKAGFEIFADLTIKVGHIGDYIY